MGQNVSTTSKIGYIFSEKSKAADPKKVASIYNPELPRAHWILFKIHPELLNRWNTSLAKAYRGNGAHSRSGCFLPSKNVWPANRTTVSFDPNMRIVATFEASPFGLGDSSHSGGPKRKEICSWLCQSHSKWRGKALCLNRTRSLGYRVRLWAIPLISIRLWIRHHQRPQTAWTHF